MTYTPGLWLFILASVIILGLTIYSIQHRHREVGRAFIFLMACALVWVVFFILETAAIELDAKLLFSKVQFVGITFLPVAWVYLVSAFSGYKLSPKYRFFLILFPLLTNIIIWTNPLHHWFFGNPEIITNTSQFAVFNLDYQFWFYFIHAPVSYLLILIAIIMLLRAMAKMDSLYKSQARLLLMAILLPLGTDLLYVLGYSPVQHYNMSTAVFSISGLLLGWILFRFRFLDLVPLAHDTVINNLDDGIIVIDHKNRIIALNPSARMKFNLSEKSIGQPLSDIKNDLTIKIDELLREQQTQIDIEINATPIRHYDLRIAPVLNTRGVKIGHVVTTRDISERVDLFNQVQQFSIKDSLTDIYNRRHFIELCNHEINRFKRYPGKPLALVMIDLDHFKDINDNYGHVVGDQVLVSFAQTIQKQLRNIDVFGRLGGEEFCVLLLEVNLAQTLRITERLRKAVEALQVPFEGSHISITASFGIAFSPHLDEAELTFEKLITLADEALYRAKENGRNSVMI